MIDKYINNEKKRSITWIVLAISGFQLLLKPLLGWTWGFDVWKIPMTEYPLTYLIGGLALAGAYWVHKRYI